SRYAPQKITTKKQHQEMSKIVTSLMRKGDEGRTPEEDKILTLIFTLIAEYERTQYPDYRGTTADLLKGLMEERGLRQRDLLPLFNNSRSYVSDVLNGRRGLSKAQAVKLAGFFNVRVEVFL
ncbi:MAG: helix-turn-helix domain-containing protein, partial [Blastocatellia bacterium]